MLQFRAAQPPLPSLLGYLATILRTKFSSGVIWRERPNWLLKRREVLNRAKRHFTPGHQVLLYKCCIYPWATMTTKCLVVLIRSFSLAYRHDGRRPSVLINFPKIYRAQFTPPHIWSMRACLLLQNYFKVKLCNWMEALTTFILTVIRIIHIIKSHSHIHMYLYTTCLINDEY